MISPRKIDPLLEKMGDARVAGLQSDTMRQDFVRIFAEIYTKDELRGMADFYDPAAGRAWADKQPQVQQKLMQAMMPRVIEEYNKTIGRRSREEQPVPPVS